MIEYSDFSIQMLKGRLLQKSMKPSTPKKYAGDMLEAYEVIVQLENQIKTTQGEWFESIQKDREEK